jgi:sucrose synthase
LQITRLLPDAVGTTCGQRLEKVYGSEHCDILRVPFRDEKGMVRKWISRFEVWPYLETYTEVLFLYCFPKVILVLKVLLHLSSCAKIISCFLQDVAAEIAKELQGKPDLIIGNYSDGNVVASLLAHKLGVTEVCPDLFLFFAAFFLHPVA